jgi:hypothetical protein
LLTKNKKNVKREILKEDIHIVRSPPPPSPDNALIQINVTIPRASPQPKHPNANSTVDTKKHHLLPKMSEMRPYRGCAAVLVTR